MPAKVWKTTNKPRVKAKQCLQNPWQTSMDSVSEVNHSKCCFVCLSWGFICFHALPHFSKQTVHEHLLYYVQTALNWQCNVQSVSKDYWSWYTLMFCKTNSWNSQNWANNLHKCSHGLLFQRHLLDQHSRSVFIGIYRFQSRNKQLLQRFTFPGAVLCSQTRSK